MIHKIKATIYKNSHKNKINRSIFNSRQAGFSLVEVIIILIIIILLGATGYYIYSRSGNNNQKSSSNTPVLFSTTGNKILDSSGNQFIPLGVTVFGLSEDTWQSNESGDISQINASASFWHANTVRIQVSPILLDANTQGYMAAIENEVNQAEKDGLNVILSAQYERTKKTAGSVTGPNDSTVSFWKIVATQYSNDQKVWFDLFNEPTGDRPYSVWKNGGNGFVGMQTLVNDIRTMAPHNIIVAESIDSPQHFAGINGEVLNGSNIVYAVHPYFHNTSRTQPLSWWQGQWQKGWGDLAQKYPLLIGEWGEYQTTKADCQLNAPQLVPYFLSYISSLRLGLIGWALIPGVMIRGNNLSSPTTFDPGISYTCKANNTSSAQGAGADMLKYFSNNGQFSVN